MDIGEASVNFPVNPVPDGSQAGHDGAACSTHITNLLPGCLVHPPPCLHQRADTLLHHHQRAPAGSGGFGSPQPGRTARRNFEVNGRNGGGFFHREG